eukprot:comp11894_c0_seq1/m.6541 comp11894_c0_seq1/g.6541  ORF comp11894_c0_seq1/g.6541 comp11894_c0_seq1/m.6541 type:complete len:251 (-) comp11894_c0_seq1:236-988(-)
MDQIKEVALAMFGGVVDDETTALALLATVLVVVMTFVFFLVGGKAQARGNSVIFTGLQGAGKTVLFTQLRDGRVLPTYTTQTANQGLIRLSEETEDLKTLPVIDIPGHSRLHHDALNKWAPAARAVVFVVDSSTLRARILDVAGCLYDVLTQNVMHTRRVPVLVLCNKQDIMTSLEPQQIREALEAEMDKVRRTRTGHVAMESEGESSEVFLGRPDQPFSFNDLVTKVTFAGCRLGKLDELVDWIRAQCR